MTDPQKSERRSGAREALLAAAERLFAEKSYDAVSTRELTEAAGVNLAAIQYHFGSKAKLFVEAIHHMMESSGCSQFQSAIEFNAETPVEAAGQIGAFIQIFLFSLLDCNRPQPCRLMFREILSSTAETKDLSDALITSFLEHFIQPVEHSMSRVLKVLSPHRTADELNLQCRSIVAQCVYYVTHRGFLEALYRTNLLEPERFSAITAQIIEFSLNALGCDEVTVRRALSAAAKRNKELLESAASRKKSIG